MKPATKKILIGLFVAIVLFILAYFFYIKPKQDQAKLDELTGSEPVKSSGGKSSTSASTDPASKYTLVTTFDNAHPIGKGMRGTQVVQLQKYLNKNNKAGLETDGLWGNDTETAFLAANFRTPDNSERYGMLTKALYDKLGLANY